MTDADAPLWALQGFEPQVENWIVRDNPPEGVRLALYAWLFTRLEDPYQGVRRVSDFPNYWYCAVPGTRSGGTAVLCSYEIRESNRTVTCKTLATLNLPIE